MNLRALWQRAVRWVRLAPPGEPHEFPPAQGQALEKWQEEIRTRLDALRAERDLYRRYG